MNNNLNGAEKLNKISVSEINKSIEAVATASNAEPKTISQIFEEILIKVDKFNWLPLKDQKQQIDKVYFINKKLFSFFDKINIRICKMERGYYVYTGTYWEYLEKEPHWLLILGLSLLGLLLALCCCCCLLYYCFW